jgi:tetratricopeptide (TPR) repeat protein
MDDMTLIKDDISHAMGAYAREDYQESIRLFNKVLSENPEHRLSLLGRGSAYLKSDRLGEAMADFDRVIALYPDYARAYHLRGVVKATRGDNLEAIKDFDKDIELDAVYGAAYASRGTAHQRLGLEDLAAEDMAMVTNLTQVNLASYNDENNVWQTQHMLVKDAIETELNRETVP